MDNSMDLFNKSFVQTLENSIAKLSQSEREELYKSCALGCVQNYVLKEQQRQFKECNGNLDEQYKRYGKSDYFFADIIESGHIYEIGYPKCLCPMYEAGLVSSPIHCECSRQSIIYVLNTLIPEKKVHVEMLHTVLSGAGECRFRVTVD